MPLLALSAGALTRLQVDAVDPTNITALASSGNTPITTGGGGLLQTGWTVADSAAAKWTPYVSATTNLPSYKNAAGTVTAL